VDVASVPEALAVGEKTFVELHPMFHSSWSCHTSLYILEKLGYFVGVAKFCGRSNVHGESGGIVSRSNERSGRSEVLEITMCLLIKPSVV